MAALGHRLGYKPNVIYTIVDWSAAPVFVGLGYKPNVISTIVDSYIR